MGPMTGRKAGYCAGFAAPGYANTPRFAGGFGGGRGYRRMFYATGMPGWARYGYPAENTAFDEKAFLSNQAELLQNELQQVKDRLSSLNEEAE
jgi:hypothetical protein